MRPTWTNHDARLLRAGGSLRNGHARLPDPVRPPRTGRRMPAPTHRGWWLICLALLLVGLLAGAARSVRGDELEPATVTPAPTHTPTEVPRYQPSARGDRPAQLERDDVVDLATVVFGPDLAPWIARLVECESTNRPGADENPPYIGLTQVDPYIHAHRVALVVGHAVTPAEAAELLRDPIVNLRTAWLILREQGAGAWPVCRFR